MIILFGLISAAFVLAICSINWRLSVKVALYAVVLEGALRKWVLPQASELIYFLKDGILFGAYIGYLIRERTAFRSIATRSSLAVLLVIFATILLLEVLNPSLNSVLVGILGAKGYLMYIPLACLLPDLFVTTEELKSYVRWFLLLSIPVCLLGVAQFFAPADSFLNVYAPSEVDAAIVTFEEGNVRVTGTFPYLGGFSVYLMFNFALIFAVIIHQNHWHWRLLLGVILLLCVADSFMTGSRGLILFILILLAAFVVFSLFERSPRSRSLSVVLIVACALCGLASTKTFPTAVEAFISRTNSDSDSMTERIGGDILGPLLALQYSGIGGYGAGSTQVACFALRNQLNLGPPAASPPPMENEMSRIMLELGAFGFLAWYGLRIYFLWLLWRTSRNVRQPALRHLAFAAFLFHCLVFTGQLVTNTTVGIFYWFLAGFAFLLPKLDQSTHPFRRQSRRPMLPSPLPSEALPKIAPAAWVSDV